jgi:hypothetical protein
MKKTYTLLLFLLATVSILAQVPEKMSYQAVLRDASNTLLTNQEVGMQIRILQSTITGVAVYIETQTTTTNINGLVSLEIGSGTSSDDFSAIDWSAGPYFIKTATDPSGGSSYTITGTSQLMSVPFAMYAKTSGSAMPGPQGVAGTQGIQGETGTAGVDGTAGTNGTNGAKGDTGITGDTGDIGEKGATGDQGTQGIQGETGTAGVDGIAGTNGTNGAKGDTGITGDTGDIGEKGATGDQGTQGIQGATGTAGLDGTAGTNGTNGVKGDTGITGDRGDVGEKGATGDQGIQGVQGNIGSVGAVGATGSTGLTGKSGVGIAQTLSFSSPNLELSDSGGSIDLTAFMGWGLTGNSGTDGSNFIGTTDDKPFNIRVNNEKSGRITAAGETFLGYKAGNVNTAVSSVGIGFEALILNTSGTENTAVGYQSLYNHNSFGGNTAVGYKALFNDESGYRNTAVGLWAGSNNTTGGDNTFIGYNSRAQAPDLVSATAIGANAQVSKNNSTAIGASAEAFAINATAIGNGARVTDDNTIQLGNTEVTAVHLGIGTNVTLQTGFVKITGGTPGLGKVLTSDAAGMASWAAAAVSVTEVDDEFTLTTSKTAFTLSYAPSAYSKVKMYVNGIRISKTAYTYSSSGTSLTYDPSNNGGYSLTVGDRIQFDYFY